ncbi:MAG: STAS domain-containing protein [Synergistaceae bacterium]|nr:STAS domain-containing protein [Synergistaceae bacterium]
MKIYSENKGSTLCLTLSGRLDTSTAPQLETEIKNSLDGIEKLELDFAGVDYVSSAGLRVLLSAQKTMQKQGELVLRNVPDVVMEVLEITGFVDILTIE